MDPFDLWEDFDENEEDYEIIDEDNAFDEMFFSKMQFYKPKRISSNEVFRELGDFLESFAKANKKEKLDWYVAFCADMLNGKKSISFEIDDIEVLEAAQQCATEGPNSENYERYITEFLMKDDEQETLNKFFKLLDTMGYYRDKLDLIENPQDLLNL